MVDFKKVLRNPAGRHVEVKGERLGAFWTPRVPVIVHSDYILNLQGVLIFFFTRLQVADHHLMALFSQEVFLPKYPQTSNR
jgi:hypothetical protein